MRLPGLKMRGRRLDGIGAFHMDLEAALVRRLRDAPSMTHHDDPGIARKDVAALL
ncbi:MAG: hypothetical protein MUF25_18230 [Pirellulaceae bacterium]|nr:hypothetical protein [Pirellulaceae bacterium]